MAVFTQVSRRPVAFVLPVMGLMGALVGLFVGPAFGSAVVGIVFGATLSMILAYGIIVTDHLSRKVVRWLLPVLLAVLGLLFIGLTGVLFGALFGWFFGWFVYWIHEGEYRVKLHPYLTAGQVLWHYSFRVICGLIFGFLITPILVLIPLSFNQEPYFSFTPGMLSFDPVAYSLRWYMDILQNGMVDPNAVVGWWSDMWSNAQWIRSIRNSFFIGFWATIVATALGTLAAIGLASSDMPWRRPIMALLISPMIVPLVITASGLFFFFSSIGIAKTYVGIILAHAALGTPFVIITVTATLSGFDQSLTRASANMGAGPIRTFFKVQMPLILPGVISGALFAFITSFDEVVAVLQLADVRQRTIPRQMFSGIREQISPTILAVVTILVIISILLLTTVELLRRRSERLHGVSLA